MHKKALLLNSTYQVISFISEKKTLKLVIKEKVEIISSWDEFVFWNSGSLKLPAVLKLKKYIKRNFISQNFSRRAVIKRDKSICQYCQIKLHQSQITIDHVIPKILGGTTSFYNCVVACHSCNNKKGSFLLEQTSMFLLKVPTHPSLTDYVHNQNEIWHNDWNTFLIN